MRERLRLTALGLLASGVGVLLVGGAAAADDAAPAGTSTEVPTETPSATPTEVPSETPTPSPIATEPAAPAVIEDAVLRWGVNNESNNKAFAPRTFNVFSAGLLPDPGQGGVTIKQAQWQQSAGRTRIEKWDGSAWQPATWAGLGTDSSGVALTSPTEGRFSNHTFVMSGGAGTVDTGARTAHIAWDADVTVLYYSGMSFFHLSDPVLDVAAGRGTVTAVVHGYRSSQSDPGVWEDVAARRVTIADLPTVDLTGVLGFVAAPAYAGVQVTGVPQVTEGAATGSFPQSFVDHLDQLGAAAFWYSSGAATDPFKPALPLTVSYDARAPVVAPEPADEPSATGWATGPEPAAPVTPPAAPSLPAAAAPTAPPGAPPAVPVPGIAAAEEANALLARPATDVRLVAAPVAPDPVVAESTDRLWWLGGGLLLATALVLLVPGTTTPRGTTATP